MNKKRFATTAVQGKGHRNVLGAVSFPIFQSANFLYEGESDYHALKYIRLNNTPNHEVLHETLAALEGSEAALVTASGMAAISTVLLTALKSGDHLLSQPVLYGGAYTLITRELARFGIGHAFIDPDHPEAWDALVSPRTRAIYVESVANPLLDVIDLEAIIAFAGRHGILSIVDNTLPTPANYAPISHGFDVVVHSATKYLNGHSDIVAGVIAGKESFIRDCKEVLDHLGGSMDPHACFLFARGLKTLAVRMEAHNRNALKVAEFLSSHPEVAVVRYPGLPHDPSHERARRWFQGFGGMVSFELRGGATAAAKFLECLTVPLVAPSLGGVESLITRPSLTCHSGLSPEERAKLGITDALVRMSVGIEDPEDLTSDLDQALPAPVAQFRH